MICTHTNATGASCSQKARISLTWVAQVREGWQVKTRRAFCVRHAAEARANAEKTAVIEQETTLA